MSKNISSFTNYINNIDFKFTVIGISETWLMHSNVDTLNIIGYSQENLYRSHKIGGGLEYHCLLLIQLNISLERISML